MTTLDMIDVSVDQGVIDWNQVHKADIVAAGIKATEGLGSPDPKKSAGKDAQFPRNWERSKLRGIRRIAYHFLKPSQDGWNQADFFHGYVRDNGHFQAGDAVMLDLEDADGQSADDVVTCACDFVTNVLENTNAGVYLYTGPDFWNNVLGSPDAEILTACPLWVATYGPAPGKVNGWPAGPTIWQYGTRSVPGITGDVDGDTFFGDLATYDLLATNGGRA